MFCFSAIQACKCKRFLLANDTFDCVTGGIASLRFDYSELSHFVIAYEYEKKKIVLNLRRELLTKQKKNNTQVEIV